jgi:hypothetical protein
MSIQLTGSVEVFGSVSSSLYGTASWAENTLSASYAVSASYAPSTPSVSASYAETASYALMAETASYSIISIQSITSSVTNDVIFQARNNGTNIPAGTPVYISSSNGTNIIVERAQALDQTQTIDLKSELAGVTQTAINGGGSGTVVAFGQVSGINLSAYTAGDKIWVSKTIGELTNVAPLAPYDRTFVGIVTKNTTNGELFVNSSQPIHFHDISSVSSSLYNNGDLWVYQASASTGIWTNKKTLSGSYSISGSLNVSSGITGSLFGTASYVRNLQEVTTKGNQTSASIGITGSLLATRTIGVGALLTVSNDGVLLNGYSVRGIGDWSHAEGAFTTALNTAHSEGESTTAKGYASHAEGDRCISSASFSHAEGRQNRVDGTWSHAEGIQNLCSGFYSHVEGYLNTVNDFDAIGLGIDSAHAEGYGNIVRKRYSHAEGYLNQTFGEASHAEGRQSITSGSFSHAEGRQTTSVGESSHSEGDGTTAGGYGAHAEGHLCIAVGTLAHAEGYQSRAIGPNSHAEGWQNSSIGTGSHAEGLGTSAVGDRSHAEGRATISIGQWSHAEGNETTAIGQASHTEGLDTIASGSYQHVQGQWNAIRTEDSAVIIGDGTSDGARANLFVALPTLQKIEISGSLLIQSASVDGEVISNIGDTFTSTEKATKIVTCTAAEYAGIATKNPNTFYIVI